MGKTADAIYVFCEKNWVIPLKNDRYSLGTGIESAFWLLLLDLSNLLETVSKAISKS
jgi:hypothetical protein